MGMDDPVSSEAPALESLLSPASFSGVQVTSKSRRRRKAKQASRARKDAAGDGESSGSITEPSSAEIQPVEKVTVLSAKRQKAKSKTKNVAPQQSAIDPATNRLMSPTKKCQHEEKIAKALENRGLILQEKSQKVRQQTKKVEDARQHKAAVLLQVRDNLSDRLKRAEEKRLQQITTIKSRARDEATKVDEINFINNLKSQNRIMDVMEKDQKVVSRQQILEEERAKRNEENRARDAAVEDRRRQQEQERVTKISEMEEKKRLKVKKVEQNVDHRRQLVRVKARDREQKLTAIEAAQQANLDSLKERIQKKIEISTRLHEERMELKRLRAQYLRSPRPGSADSFGHFQDMMHSERCRSHTGDNSPRGDADVKDKIRAQIEMDDISLRYERMGNKLRQRLIKHSLPIEVISRGSHMESGDVSQAMDLLGGLRCATSWSAWSHQITASLDPCLERLTRHIGFILRSKDKTLTEELRTGALQTVEFSIAAIAGAISNESSSSVPEKPVCAMYNLLSVLLECNTFNTLLTTNVFIGVLEQAKYFADILVFGNGGQRIVPETVFTSCFQAVERILYHFRQACSTPSPLSEDEECNERLTDCVKYLMTCGLVQMIGRYHTLALHHDDDKLRYLRRSFQYTTWISRVISARKLSAEGGTPTRIHEMEMAIYRDVLKSAPVFSSVTLLYDLLRLGRSQPRSSEASISELSEESYRVAVDIIRMLNYIGGADLLPLQTVFRVLALSIQFRHICSFLIEHCLSFHQERAFLLHEVVLLIGQFAFLSTDHQDIVHAGHPPTLLQQLARFPVEYFTCGTLQDVLIPTLIICCFQNRKNCAIMSEEMDLNHLTLYIKDREMNSWPNQSLHQQLALARKATPLYENLFREHSGEDFFRYSFPSRFPPTLWNAAAQFFYVSSAAEDDHTVVGMGKCTGESRFGHDENLDAFFRQLCPLLTDGGGIAAVHS